MQWLEKNVNINQEPRTRSSRGPSRECCLLFYLYVHTTLKPRPLALGWSILSSTTSSRVAPDWLIQYEGGAVRSMKEEGGAARL